MWTNLINGKSYVGSSLDLYNRFRYQLSPLSPEGIMGVRGLEKEIKKYNRTLIVFYLH